MALSPRTTRIILALLVSFAFIAASYYFSAPLRADIANANSTEELLKAYAAKDTDADGLPDWQESLYGTDPENPHSVDPVLTDGEAVDQGKIEPKFKSAAPAPDKVTAADIPGDAPAAGSLTDQFAKKFFQNFMLSQHVGANPSSEDVQKFVESSIADLEGNGAKADVYTKADVTVSGSGPAALSAYAVTMATGFGTKSEIGQKDELAYLNDAVINNDPKALAKIASIASAYKSIAEGMKKVSVPQEAAATHLELMNTAMSLSETIEDMAAFKEDPLRTFLGIEQYLPTGVRLIRALAAMDQIFHQAGISIKQGESGYAFYGTLEQAAAALASLPAE